MLDSRDVSGEVRSSYVIPASPLLIPASGGVKGTMQGTKLVAFLPLPKFPAKLLGQPGENQPGELCQIPSLVWFLSLTINHIGFSLTFFSSRILMSMVHVTRKRKSVFKKN